jgi:hypothetical protein
MDMKYTLLMVLEALPLEANLFSPMGQRGLVLPIPVSRGTLKTHASLSPMSLSSRRGSCYLANLLTAVPLSTRTLCR